MPLKVNCIHLVHTGTSIKRSKNQLKSTLYEQTLPSPIISCALAEKRVGEHRCVMQKNGESRSRKQISTAPGSSFERSNETGATTSIVIANPMHTGHLESFQFSAAKVTEYLFERTSLHRQIGNCRIESMRTNVGVPVPVPWNKPVSHFSVALIDFIYENDCPAAVDLQVNLSSRADGSFARVYQKALAFNRSQSSQRTK